MFTIIDKKRRGRSQAIRKQNQYQKFIQVKQEIKINKMENKQLKRKTILKKNYKKLDKEIQQLDSDEQKQKDELKKIKKRFSSKSTMKLIYGKIQINSLENFILYLNQIKLLIINHSNQKMNEIDQVKCFK